MSVGLKKYQFMLQDEHGSQDSFNYAILIWNSNDQGWKGTNGDYSILTVSPTSGTFDGTTNLPVEVTANFHAVNAAGSAVPPFSTGSKKGELLFAFFSPDAPSTQIGWILFNASNNRWHIADSDQSQIDIDWHWNDGKPKIEVKEK